MKAAPAVKTLIPSPGNESFEDFIRDSCYYVDKTQYLMTIFKYSSKRLLMLRPRDRKSVV